MITKSKRETMQKYRHKAYERIEMLCPAGSRDSYREQAKARGYSLAEYALALMDADATPDELTARNAEVVARRIAAGLAPHPTKDKHGNPLPPRPVPGQTAPETTPPESPED